MDRAAHRCGSLPRETIARQRADGISVAEIANEAGVSRRTMYNALSAWGLVGQRGGDHRSRNWQTLFREQLAHAIASACA
jgi:hypothetical protein